MKRGGEGEERGGGGGRGERGGEGEILRKEENGIM